MFVLLADRTPRCCDKKCRMSCMVSLTAELGVTTCCRLCRNSCVLLHRQLICTLLHGINGITALQYLSGLHNNTSLMPWHCRTSVPWHT